jgi:hypothetical protein
MRLSVKKSNYLLILMGCSVLGLRAQADEYKGSYMPETYISGYGGTGFDGQLDVLAPIYATAKNNLFVYGQGRISLAQNDGYQNTWAGSIGAGYRQVAGNRIYGGYLFTDYSSSSFNNKFVTLSPGLESLGSIIDVRVNGYIPLGTKTYATTEFASNMGNYDYTHATGNSYYDHKFTFFDENTYGADAEIGAKLFSIKHMPIKLFADGYYFASGDYSDQVEGIGGRLTFEPTKYLTLEVKDTYDNLHHNIILGGIKVYLNGFRYGLTDTNVDEQPINYRLVDTVERNLGEAAQASPVSSQAGNDRYASAPNPSPDNNTIYDDGEDYVKYDNIEYVGNHFTDPNAKLGSAENPFPYINQSVADQANQEYSGVEYIMIAGNQRYDNCGNINLYANQSMLGMTPDYSAPAKDDARPMLNGALILNGYNTVDSLELFYSVPENLNTTGILVVPNSQSIVISNTLVGGTVFHNDIYQDNFQTGIKIGAGSSVQILDTKINSAYQQNGVAIEDDGAKNLLLDKVNIYAAFPGTGIKIIDDQAEGDTVKNINNTSIYTQGSAGGADILVERNNNPGKTVINLNTDQITGAYDYGPAYGVYLSSSNIELNVTDTSITTNYSGNCYKTSLYGIYASPGSKVNLFGNTKINTNKDSNTYGIYADGAIVNINDNSKISVSNGYGIYLTNGAQLNFNSGIVTATINNTINANLAVGIYANNVSFVNFNGGEVQASGAGTVTGIYANNGSLVNFNGGEVQASGAGTVTGIYANNSSFVDFAKGKVQASDGGTVVGIYTDKASMVNFTGGEVQASGGGTVTGIRASGNGTVVEMKGGQINVSGSGTLYGVYATNYADFKLDSGIITVEYTGANVNTPIYGIYVDKNAMLDLYSGTINAIGLKNDSSKLYSNYVYGIYGGTSSSGHAQINLHNPTAYGDNNNGLIINVTGSGYQNNGNGNSGIYVVDNKAAGTLVDFSDYYNWVQGSDYNKDPRYLLNIQMNAMDPSNSSPYAMFIPNDQQVSNSVNNSVNNYYIVYGINGNNNYWDTQKNYKYIIL